MITFFSLLHLSTLILQSHTDRRIGNGAIQEALNLGQTSNSSREDCIWKMDNEVCSKAFIKYRLYTNQTSSLKSTGTCGNENDSSCENEDVKSEDINLNSPAWLHSSNWNPSSVTVVLVHGYGGTSDMLPIGILRDAYLKNGTYNVIVADWGPLAKLPCYIAAVHNIKVAAKCLAELFVFLRNSGVDMKNTACVGHSLGAHVCGVMSNFLNFRLQKIIGLDPAKPLIPNPSMSKLDAADAEMVQILHTSSKYGNSRKSGHVDFYFNGGRIQPFCVDSNDEELCSHLRSVCYMAESIFSSSVRYATKCRRRNMIMDENLKGILNREGNAHFVPIGQATPNGVVGTYCVSNIDAPFCSTNGTNGNPLCCKPKKGTINPQLIGRSEEGEH